MAVSWCVCVSPGGNGALRTGGMEIYVRSWPCGGKTPRLTQELFLHSQFFRLDDTGRSANNGSLQNGSPAFTLKICPRTFSRAACKGLRPPVSESCCTENHAGVCSLFSHRLARCCVLRVACCVGHFRTSRASTRSHCSESGQMQPHFSNERGRLYVEGQLFHNNTGDHFNDVSAQ